MEPGKNIYRCIVEKSWTFQNWADRNLVDPLSEFWCDFTPSNPVEIGRSGVEYSRSGIRYNSPINLYRMAKKICPIFIVYKTSRTQSIAVPR